MSSNESVTFREFHDPELLLELGEILQDHAIPFTIEDTRPRFDITFSNDRSQLIYLLKVKRENLEQAKQVAEAIDLETMKELPSDYYLFAFPDNELKNIIAKSTEWSSFDVMLAEKLLQERGVELKQEDLRDRNRKRSDLLDGPHETEFTFLVILGYMISVIGLVIPLFLFLGCIIPILMLALRKRTPEGKRVPYFNDLQRIHARVMLVIPFLILMIFTNIHV